MIQHNKPTLDSVEEQAAQRVIRSGWLAQGQEVEKFENEFCQFLGLPEKHAVVVTNGTTALFLALWALKAQNRKVAIPVYGCSSLRHAVAMAGGQEVLVDTAPQSPNIDLDQLKQTDAPIAVIPHMYGLSLDLSGWDDRIIIEDCAQALGAKVGDRCVGLQGQIGIFSFAATKLMTSGGQGGMVVSRNRELIDSIRDYREFDCRHDHKRRFNFQLTDLQAAIGRVQLKKLPGFLARREEIFLRYQEAGLELLGVANNHGTNICPVRYRAIVLTDEQGHLLESLAKERIKAIIPIEDWELLGPGGSFPNSFKLTQTTVSLPIYPSLTEGEVKKIIGILQ